MTWLAWIWLGLACGAIVVLGVLIIRRSVGRDD